TSAVVTTEKPAAPGALITSYLVGLGATNPQLATGATAVGPAPTVVQPSLTVGGKTAAIVYSGLAAGIPGVYQLTFQVPADVSGGNQKVILKIGTRVTADGPQLPIAAGAPSAPIVANGATFQVRDTLHPLAPNTFVSIFSSNIGMSDTAQSIFPAAQYQGTSV